MREPRLSIGLPVYNGENYLTQSVDGLLGQSYGDFELIISDNASTDGTEEICRDYAAADRRIRYLRQPRNLGASPNHNLLFHQARGELFKWASHDDLYGPDLLASCVRALDEHPDAVLAHTDMAVVDESGTTVNKFDYALDTGSPWAPERFRALLYGEGGDDEYGVIRSEVLRRTPLQGSFHNPGRPFVAELALSGPFHQVHELQFFRRDHPDRGDRRGSVRAVCANLDPRRARQSTARLVAEYVTAYIAAIRRAPLSSADRRRCYLYLALWLGGRAASWPASLIGRGR